MTVRGKGAVVLLPSLAPLLLLGGTITPWILVGIVYPLLWPLSYAPIDLGVGTISPERALVAAAFVGFLGLWATRRLQVPRLPGQVVAGGLLFIGTYVGSLLVRPTASGVVQVVGLIQKATFAYLVVAFLTDETRLRTAMRMYIIGALVSSIIAAYLILSSGDPSYLHSGYGTFRGAQGIVNAAGVAVRFLPMAAWVTLIEWRLAQGGRMRWLILLLFLWLWLGATLIARRDVLLSGGIGLLALVFYRPAGLRKFALGTLPALSALVLFIVLPSNPFLWDRVLGETPEVWEGVDERIGLLRASVHAVLDSPILGCGPGLYAYTLATRYTKYLAPIAIRHGYVTSSHNSFASAAVEAGLISLAGLMLLILGVFRELQHAQARRASGYLGIFVEVAPIFLLQLVVWWNVGNVIIENLSWFWLGAMVAGARLAVKPTLRDT